MPTGHDYQPANTTDHLADDPESDIDLDVQELGPRLVDDDGRSRREGANATAPNGEIPLRNMRRPLRTPGRRAKKFEEAQDGGTLDGEDQRPGSQEGGSVEGQVVGDSTPLLHVDQDGPSTASGATGGILSRARLSPFGPRRAGYQNIGGSAPGGDREETGSSRNINIGQYPPPRYPSNAISNAKYTPWSFLPRTLYNEFSFFINLYFLLVALSQLIPQLRIGVLWTYMAPLAFVLSVTLGKEAYDDVERRKRDAEANRELYTMLRLRDPGVEGGRKKGKKPKKRGRANNAGQRRLEAIEEEEEDTGGVEVEQVRVKSKDIKVGDILVLGKDNRVPADVIILKSMPSERVVAAAEPEQTSTPEQPDLLSEQDDSSNPTSEAAKDAANNAGPSETSEGAGVGETFIRTDQLDGETDWKLRIACNLTQALEPPDFTRLTITAGKPSKKVNDFLGRIELRPKVGSGPREDKNPARDRPPEPLAASLSIDNTAWANTVLASNAIVLAAVVYTGAQTRQALSTAPSRSKVGLLEYEINNLTKILCLLTVVLCGILVGLEAYQKNFVYPWFVAFCRFLILFSSIIPISLRVNMDLGKTFYSYIIHHDKEMDGAVVRTSTIPEDLGRIEYLLSDKTGTLTQNEMDLRKIHVGTVSYANEAMEEVASYVRQGFALTPNADATMSTPLVTPSSLLNAASGPGTRTRREIGSRVRDVVLALALCHNVTPTTEEKDGRSITTYQASSPDEIAIVRWTESVGLRVVHRDRHNIALQCVANSRIVVRVRILEVFPFTSEGKRMGIILQYLAGTDAMTPSEATPDETWFYQKGADTVMASIVAANDWLEEETANMAREGLRTLVVGRRKLLPQQYAEFASAYQEASLSLHGRDAAVTGVVSTHLERDLELLGVTGVEDKLQRDVKPSLELLRNAGVKIWMLTGDKVETARCVAVASKLVARSQHIHTVTRLEAAVRNNPTLVPDTLSLLAASPASTALLIDGDSLAYLLTHHRQAFITLAVQLPAVVACRCSPTQKADVALLIRAHTKKRVACIGDGGNDVSMIQAADVGVGVAGKEGRQAALAADFAIAQFRDLTRLLVWHGRNSYKRSAKLAQVVIHRGLVIAVAQAAFSVAVGSQPAALFKDWLWVGYATAYTQLPLFSLVLDRDVEPGLATLYPELYKELAPGQSLSYRTFAAWLAVSVYQGLAVQLLAQFLVGRTFVAPAAPAPSPALLLLPRDPATNITDLADRLPTPDPSMVAVSFTALVLTELAMVALAITTWHWAMGAAIALTLCLYVGSVPLLGAYFDLEALLRPGFYWKVAAIAAVSLVPPWIIKIVGRAVRPPSYRKVRGV